MALNDACRLDCLDYHPLNFQPLFSLRLEFRSDSLFVAYSGRPGCSQESARAPAGNTAVPLASLPGERHGLGLFMVEALLWRSGKATLNPGTDIPMEL